MTDFRPVRRLLAYSGGTVPDSDRIHYSPPVQKAKLAALEQYMKLHVLYTRKTGLSIGDPEPQRVVLEIAYRKCEAFTINRQDLKTKDSPLSSIEFSQLLCALPLEDLNAVLNPCCRLCSAYGHRTFLWHILEL